MIVCKMGCSKKEVRIIENIMENTIDLYADAYITRQNIRISLRENIDIFIKCLNKGDEWVYDADREDGLAMISGWSDKSKRMYVKVLTRDMDLANNFLKIIAFKASCDLYCKLKKNNPLVKVFQKNNYQFVGDRGSELLLCRKFLFRPERIMYKKEEDQ